MYNKLYRSFFYMIFILSTIVFYTSFTPLLQDNENINRFIFLVCVPTLIMLNLVCLGLSKHKLVELFFLIFPVVLVIALNASFSYTLAYLYAMNLLMPKDTSYRFLYFLVSVKILFLIFIIFLYSLGIIPDVTLLKSDGITIRHSLGFLHPNSLGGVFLSITIDIVLLLASKPMRYPKLLAWFLLILTILVYYISYSRTSMLLGMSIICLIFFRRMFSFYILSGFSKVVLFLFISFLGVFLSYCYDGDDEFLFTINELFSQRLLYANAYFANYDITLLPKKIELLYKDNFDIIYNENFYASAILSQGVILYGAYLLYMCYFLVKIKFSLYTFLLICISFICAMFEGYGMSVFFSSTLLFNLPIYKKDMRT